MRILIPLSRFELGSWIETDPEPAPGAVLSDDRSLATRIGVTAIGHLLQLELGTVQGRMWARHRR